MIERCPYEDMTPGDTSPEEPGDRGYDLVEPKHDGLWGCLTVTAGRGVLRSITGTVKRRADLPGMPDSVLLGEYLVGTSWSRSCRRHRRFVVFDALSIDGGDISRQSLARRRLAACGLIRAASADWLELTEQFSADRWRELWSRLVEASDFEGLVFKASSAPYGARYGAPWARMKRSCTVDYVLLGVNEGKGRLAGTAGSLRGGVVVNGTLKHVCDVPGLSDALRRRIAADPQALIGHVFEAEGAAVYPTGALRHPRFVRFRTDKRAADCVLAA